MVDHKWAARVGIAAVILTVVACGDDDNGSPFECDPQLNITNGNNQAGEVSVQLPDTLIVQATTCDPANQQGSQIAEPNVPILWVVESGGGTVNGAASDTVLTDADGRARAIWVLGPNEGQQTVSATALRASADDDEVTFTATATAPASGCPLNSVQHAGGLVTSDETWGPGGHVVNGNITIAGTATLTIQAGAHVCLVGGGLEFAEQSHLAVLGSAGNPVIIEEGFAGASINFGVNIFSLTTPSTISNARLEGVGITVSGNFHPVVVESTLVRDATVSLGAPGSEFSLSTIVRGRLIITALAGGILVEGTVRDSDGTEGIFINGSGVTIIRSEVSGTTGVGIRSAGDATTITVNSSNIFGNSDVGLSNGDVNTLDASGNWWGDPAGPGGPNGDGVAGSVDVSGALAGPAVLGYRPPE